MNKTIPQIVDELVQADPDAPSITFRGEASGSDTDDSLTYGQLWERACRFANALRDTPQNAHVMLVMPLGTRLLAAHLSVLLHGGMASIFTHPSEKIKPEVYRRNLQNAIAKLHPGAIITCRAFLDTVQRALDVNAFQIVVAEDVPDSGDYRPAGWRNQRPDEAAVIQYSSGSTGLQKCVQLSHEMVVGQCDSYARFIALDRRRDRICSWLPLYHDMGLFTSWLMPLLHGVPVSMIDPFQWVQRPGSLFNLISDSRGTLCWQPNFAFRLLASRLRNSDLTNFDLSSMRGFTNCSEPVSFGAMDEFASAFRHIGVKDSALWVCYAMAENAFAVTASGGPNETPRTISADRQEYAQGIIVPAAGNSGIDLVSCGVPIEGCEIRVVDNQRQQLPDAQIGEISLHSTFMLTEYVRSPELTREAIDDSKWYYTGDLGFLREGRLYVTGRKKDLLIVGGRNFYPQDIEGIAGSCEGTIPGRTVAIGTEDPELGTQKVVILAESHLSDEKAKSKVTTTIRQQVFDGLDCPIAEVHIVPHMWLLKTSSGKIARQPNLEKYRAEHAVLVPKKITGAAPATVPVERAGLAETAMWSMALALSLYLYTLFFLLGDSKSWNIYAGF